MNDAKKINTTYLISVQPIFFFGEPLMCFSKFFEQLSIVSLVLLVLVNLSQDISAHLSKESSMRLT